MKKALKITAVVALTGFALASCKKDYTCSCADPTGLYTQDYTYVKVKEADAQANCDAQQASWAAISSTITCTLSEN